MLKLGGKLIIGVLLTLGIILSLGFYLVLERQSSDLLAEARDSTKVISTAISSELGELLAEIKVQQPKLQDAMLDLVALAEIKNISFVDESRTVTLPSNTRNLPFNLSDEQLRQVGYVFIHGLPINHQLDESRPVQRLLPIFSSTGTLHHVAGVVVLDFQSADLMLEQVDALSNLVQNSLSDVLRQTEVKKSSLSHLISQFRLLKPVTNLELYSEQLTLLDSRVVDDFPMLQTSIEHVFSSKEVYSNDNVSLGYYQRLTPSISADGDDVIGVVHLVINIKPELEKLESLSHLMRVIAVVVAITITFVLYWFMQRVVLAPIKSLSESAKSLAQGDFDKVAVSEVNDEISQLGHSFNSMVDYLFETQAKLIGASEYNENILRTMSDALLVMGTDNRIEHVNDAAVGLLDYRQRSDLVGFPLSLVCSDTPSCQDSQLSFMMESEDFDDREKYMVTRTGSYIPVLLSFSHFYDVNGKIEGAVCVARDITERKRADEYLRDAHDKLEQRVVQRTKELFQEKERLQVTLHSIGEAVVTADSLGLIEYLNPVAERITGWSLPDVQGRPLGEALPLFDENGGRLDTHPLYQCLNEGYCDLLSINHSMNLQNRDKQMIAIESSMAPMLDGDGSVVGVVLVFRDVSEERKLRKQLLHQASHDALTGLSNRLVFEKRLGEALQMAREKALEHAVLFLDLDQFKVVNDTCGHVAGDALLQQLTSILRDKMRATDVLARLGGDEFGVILNNCSLDHAKKIATLLLSTVREFRFTWEDKTFEIGVSIGLVMLDETSVSVASVMSAADIACYAAKDGGRNRYHIYETSDEELKQRHGEMQWVTLISKAIQDDSFVLHFQEIAYLNNEKNQIKHYEVLLRMVGENGELIPPGAFLPAAERYGLITSVDRWVIENSLTQLARYLKRGLNKEVVFAINLSGLSIGDEDFLEYIKEQITKHELPYHSICFEITETAAVANLTKASAFIKSLKALGCKFALDDFGCGVSSFSYLKNLPVDFLKIDGMFVRDMSDDSIDYAMVEAINNIGQVMGLKTIAEFVESQAILDCLVALEVDYAQGYFIAEPMPLEDIV